MIRHLTRIALILSLTAALAASGVMAAFARGQTRAGGDVLVLCSGGGLVQITLDENGQPTGKSHLCPDLALGLIAALDTPPPDSLRPQTASSDIVIPSSFAVAAADVPALRARGPPLAI